MKRFCVLALALMLLSTLAACGCSNSTGDTTDRPTTTPTTGRPTTMPTTDPTIGTNIPDPSVDTSMPDFTGSTNDTGATDGAMLPGMQDTTGAANS